MSKSSPHSHRLWHEGHKSLARQVSDSLDALRGQQPARDVNLSIPRHGVITPVLWKFAFDPNYQALSIPVVFSDGSKPEPFPVGIASPHSPQNLSDQVPSLLLGLMSFRHPELDYIVDLYVTRNKELADQPTMADEELLSFERTTTLLTDPSLRDGGTLSILHTGLEPMVVGFYRAVVTVLRQRMAETLPRNLVVQPLLYGSPPTRGRLSAQSPGAQLSNYLHAQPWC